MSLTFFLNAVLALALLVAISLMNLLSRDRKTLKRRLGALGLSLSLSVALYSAYHLKLVAATPLNVGSFAFSCWLSGLLYLSFLIDMTATHRSRYFWLSYFLPIPLAVSSALLPRPVGPVILVSVGVILVVRYTASFLVSWVRAATDDRARRDGEWMLLVFLAFGLGLAVSFSHALTGVYWLLALWLLTMHYTVNYLQIYETLTDRENLLIIDNVFDIVIILGVDGKVMRMNRRGYQITAFPPSRVIGEWVERIVVHPNLDAARRREWLADYAWTDTGRDSTRRTPSIDASVSTRDGEEIPVDLRIVCLVNLSGEKTGYVISASDMRITRQLMKEISDREYAARDLALSESKFSRMFIFNPTGILIVDLDSMSITDANPAAEEIFASDARNLVGKTLGQIGLEMSELPYGIFVDRLQLEGTVPEFPATIRIDDETTRIARLSAVTFDLNHTRRVLLSVADVTQSEELREALTRKQKMETVGLLAGGIAHDFNNILAVILGHIGLIKMKAADPLARSSAEKAEAACVRAREMTGQLLAFSRGGQPVFGECEAKDVITESAMMACADTSVACLFDIPDDLWKLRADRIQIGQVVNNLVTNAVDAMGGSGIISIRAVNVDFSNVPEGSRPMGPDSRRISPGPYLELRFHDQGRGVPDSIRKKIFDPFFSTKKKGTGLGLSIVFSVVQNHGGAISVGSGSDGGAVFTVYLPAWTEETRLADAPVSCPEPSTFGEGKRILLMDDDPEVRGTAAGLFSSLGFTVLETEEGASALRAYKEALDGGRRFDYCVLDLVVPNGMAGARCAEEILAVDPRATLIVSSGYSDDPVLSRWRDYGFVGVLPKPYTREELKFCISSVLAQRVD